jgi:hypothetical protein
VTFRRWLYSFFSLLALSTLLLACGLAYSIHLSRQDAFVDSFGDPSLVIQEQGFLDRNRRCEVLLYGDSTASIGLDPRLITAQTGLSACNIATTRPIVDDLETLPLDAFLRHNPAPRVIVLQLGPEAFYRGDPWTHNGPLAPFLMLARDLPTAQAVRTMLLHAPEATQFVIGILKQRFAPNKISAAQQATRQAGLEYWRASNGRLDLHLPAETSCRYAALKLRGPVDTAWITELRHRYETQGTVLLIRASPIPACDPQLAVFQRDLQSHVDVNVQPLPINNFVAGGSHTTADGARVATQGVIEALHTRLH